MLDCLIVGDSIAVGTHMVMPKCAMIAKGGINSYQYNRMYRDKPLQAQSVIISLGSNDHPGVHTFKELLAMRQRVDAAKVYWIMPAIHPNVQDIIEIIARNFGDTIIKTKKLQPDGVHPATSGYKELAKSIEE